MFSANEEDGDSPYEGLPAECSEAGCRPGQAGRRHVTPLNVQRSARGGPAIRASLDDNWQAD